MDARVAHKADVPHIAATIAAAFAQDPVWGWAFGDPTHGQGKQEALWTLAFSSAVQHPWVWTTPSYEAVTLWIPPGEPELTEEYAAQVEPLIHTIAGSRADLILEVFECFDRAHPDGDDYFYLSLLGTHPLHRGSGLGMRLLSANLAEIDKLGAPAYLESTNDANLGRYESVGFTKHGAFDLPDGGPTVTTMWRPAR